MKRETKPREPAGPKTRIPNRRTINLSLSEAQIEKAREVGMGNISAGVRTAIDGYTASFDNAE